MYLIVFNVHINFKSQFQESMQKNTLKILKRQRDQVWFQLCKKAQTNFEPHHFFIGLTNIGGNEQPKAI